MCVRTKTSFGCGCAKKSVVHCEQYDPEDDNCSEVTRCHVLQEGDCRECKEGGESITRGREGKGYYAQKIARREERARRTMREPFEEIANDTERSNLSRRSSDSPIVVPSPWVRSRPREKEWNSPERRKADEMWLREHDTRTEELCSRLGSYSIQDSPSVQHEPEVIHEVSHAGPEEYEPDYYQYEKQHRRRDDTASRLHSEIRAIDSRERRRRRRTGERSGSYESIHSVSPPQSHMSKRSYDSGYSSGYGHHHAYPPLTRAKTEPYLALISQHNYASPRADYNYGSKYGYEYRTPAALSYHSSGYGSLGYGIGSAAKEARPHW